MLKMMKFDGKYAISNDKQCQQCQSIINNSPIYSSQSGKVAFIGSQIKKFGNLILIKHKNGWLTAYSNVGKSSVKLEDKVTKGQVIAYSSSDKEIFHFQIRYKRKPVDPVTYLNQ